MNVVIVDGPNWNYWRREIYEACGHNLDIIKVAELLVGKDFEFLYVSLKPVTEAYEKFVYAISCDPRVITFLKDRDSIIFEEKDAWVDQKIKELIVEKGRTLSKGEKLALMSRDGDFVESVQEVKNINPNVEIVIPEFYLPSPHVSSSPKPSVSPVNYWLEAEANTIVNLGEHLSEISIN